MWSPGARPRSTRSRASRRERSSSSPYVTTAPLPVMTTAGRSDGATRPGWNDVSISCISCMSSPPRRKPAPLVTGAPGSPLTRGDEHRTCVHDSRASRVRSVCTAASGEDQHFPFRVAPLDVAVGPRGIGQRPGPVDADVELPSGHPPEQVAAAPGPLGGVGDVGGRAWAARRPPRAPLRRYPTPS